MSHDCRECRFSGVGQEGEAVECFAPNAASPSNPWSIATNPDLACGHFRPALPLRVLAATTLPTEAADRKNIPIMRGCLDYFPAALAAVARVSKKGNDQHNPGQPMHHARGKSTDHADCCVRHMMDRGTIDTDGERHSAKAAWRALANLQEELELAGEAPLARGAKLPEGVTP
jgi:hypothetical protein